MFMCDFINDPVCIPQAYAEVRQNVAGLRTSDPAEPSPAAIEQAGVKIVNLYSDVIGRRKAEGFSQFCLDDVCVHYVKTCNVGALSCRYVIGVQASPADPQFTFIPREFYISATSADVLSRAQAAILIGRPGARNVISLDQLRDEVSKPALERLSLWRLG